jgi:hypothetical protein
VLPFISVCFANGNEWQARPPRQRKEGGRVRPETPASTHTRISIRAKKTQPKRDFQKLTKGKFFVCTVANARHDAGMRAVLPKSVAQLTGMLVTAIVAFGTDVDVYYAVPLGVFAGALAIFFVSLSEEKEAVRAR